MGLYKKLLEVMKKIPEIQKSGYNSFHDYRYATEEDIVKPIRSLLIEHGVLLISKVLNTETTTTDKGEFLVTQTLEFKFVDVDTGETLTCTWVGAGIDKGDKGVYKAQTGALKYFLLKTFLIPTVTDPENPRLEVERYDEPATENQKNLVKKLVAQQASATGKTVQEVEAAYKIDYSKLTKSKASELIDTLMKKH